MIKKLIFSLILTFLTLFFIAPIKPISAENEFNVDAQVTYKVQDSGKTIVTHNITLENNFSTLYATTYTLSLENIDAQTVTAHDNKGKVIPTDTQKEGDKTSIKLTFEDPVVGKNARRNFLISYENASFATRTGEVWEVSIPRLSNQNSFNNYQVILEVPPSFGLEAYISPRPTSSEENNGGHIYTFSKENVIQTGITAGFGQFQVFSFNLSYHLENPLARNSETTVAIPPDTAFQKVYLSKIEPKPDNIQLDADGNWLAIYKLSPRQRIDVMVTGAVQIFAGFRPFPKPTEETLSHNLKETQYWQSNDPQIKALASLELSRHSLNLERVQKKLSYFQPRWFSWQL